MGPVLSQLKDDGAEKEKDQLNMMEENMKNKLMDFKKAIQLQRGDNVSATEIGGGRTVQRSTTMRVVHKTGTSEGIKSAVGDFFDAAQGGKKAKASALKGAQKLIGSSIDGLLGTGSGSSNECSEFVVVFMNYSFVRIDYMAYYYNVEGKGILKSGQQGGFCSIMDVSIIPHEQIRNEEITYLLSQALHMEPGESSFEKDLKVLMTLEVLLAEERLLTRKMNDETTTLEDIRRMKEQLNNNKGDQISAFDSLPDADLPDIMVRIDAYNALSDDERKLEDSLIEAALDAYVAEYMQQLTAGETKANAKEGAAKATLYSNLSSCALI